MSKPILFSGPMVRALLAGTKTQTRRPIKRHPLIDGGFTDEYIKLPENYVVDDCPYGQVGDLLYVREAIKHVGNGVSIYAADNECTIADAWPWKRNHLPPMHCPRGLSRLTLRIKAVRVERLQEISEADALDEGLTKWPHKGDFAYGFDGGWPSGYATHTGAFNALLRKVGHGEAWDRNAWTWVRAFEVIHANIDQVIKEAP